MFNVNDLHVTADDKEILKGFTIKINKGETHILMGPNGAGKSTVCKSIFHHPHYKITKGQISYNGKDLTNETTDVVANAGIYYINQTPVEVEGIKNLELLRMALVAKGEKVDIFSFRKQCKDICTKLKMDASFLTRNVNEGMSGGERKKNELFGMWLLKPSLILLDEIDSGLDVDALKVVAENLKEYQKETGASLLVITHQPSLIEKLHPDFVHVMKDGVVTKNGDAHLAFEILEQGFGANDMMDGQKNE